ncbi:MAG: glutathione S-transferase family protein [Pseudomonadota bacterium]
MTIKLYHCAGARSLRPLWTLEEMGLAYELEVMAFPPRFLRDGYTDINPIGTVPFMTDGDVQMTESVAICQYLADVYGAGELTVKITEPEYGEYLNWMHRSDATLTFPQTLVLRYTMLEPDESLKKVVDDYSRWFFSRLRALEKALKGRDYLCTNRFTLADICVSFALYLADAALGLREGFGPETQRYYEFMQQRPALQRALAK